MAWSPIALGSIGIGETLSFYRWKRGRTNMYIGSALLRKLDISYAEKLFVLLDRDGPQLMIRPVPNKINKLTRKLVDGRISFPETVLRKYVDGTHHIKVLAQAHAREGLITADLRDAI